MRVLGRIRRADPRWVPGSPAPRALPARGGRPLPVRIVSRPAFAVLLACVLALGVASAAAAAGPTNLRSQLTDDAEVLSSTDRSRVTAALDDLLRRTGTQLWVWYTPTTGALTAPDFAAQTARLSSLGGTDLLLVIAVADRAYGYSRPEAFPLSDADLQRLLSSDLEPGLRAGDYPGAVIAFADALGSGAGATGGGGGTGGGNAGGDASGGPAGSGGTGSAPLWLAPILVVAGLALVGWYLVRRSRGPRAAGAAAGSPADPLAGLSEKELDARANELLLATDDAIRDSDTELGFAQAEFGDAEAAPFRAALDAARADMREAFRLRQGLDDEVPEDRDARRRMLMDLIGRCRSAQAGLDAQTRHFEELRDFRRRAPEVLAGLPAAADALDARIPNAEAALAHLSEYAETSWAPVARNVEEARTRIAAVRAAVTQGEAAKTAADERTVAASARAGQEAAAQATGFLDAVERLATELDGARDRVAAEISDVEADLARARATASTLPADPTLAPRLGEVEGLLAAAREDIAHPKPDVAGAYEKAHRANGIIDGLLAGMKDATERQATLVARYDTALREAQASLERASGYVSTRRGGVGSEARTRLAEAERHLDAAIAAGRTDPERGAEEARQASRMATEALGLAQRDYEGWDDPWHGGRRGGPPTGPSGGDIAGAVIGGMIGAILSGRGGGGFGGGWGGGFPGGGGFGGGGGGGRTSGGGRW